MAKEFIQGRSRTKGLTKRRYKKQFGSSTKGVEKGGNCVANGYKKGLLKYPRAYRTMEAEYNGIMKSTLKADGRLAMSMFSLA